jgi:serine phosphatase RsbU (regulator of sigma subunit)
VPGDLLLLPTDGSPECQDAEGNFFGDERALQVVAAQRQCEAREIINRLYKALQDFSAPIPQNDDITAVVCKVLLPP